MPKIIDNLPEKLAQAALRQIRESGYEAMTIRSVAKECGVGVGTVYNYYESKEMLVASFMLEDWRKCLDNIDACARTAAECRPVLESIYAELTAFIQLYEPIFQDHSAAAGMKDSFGSYHKRLRSQLAQPLRKFSRDDFTAEFAAEAILTWTVAGKGFEELNDVLSRLF